MMGLGVFLVFLFVDVWCLRVDYFFLLVNGIDL